MSEPSAFVESRDICADLRAMLKAHAAGSETRVLFMTEKTPALIARIMGQIPGGDWRS